MSQASEPKKKKNVVKQTAQPDRLGFFNAGNAHDSSYEFLAYDTGFYPVIPESFLYTLNRSRD